MADRQQVKLGAVQETLLITLAARARETRKKRPILRDPKAVQMVESIEFDVDKYGRGVGGYAGDAFPVRPSGRQMTVSAR